MSNTTTLTLNVIEQKLKLVTDTTIASGGLNDIILHFDFKDNTWDGLNIKAVFRSNYDEIAYENSVDVSTKNVIVPAEVLHEHGIIYVGLAGSIVNGQGEATLVRTTAVLSLKLEKGTPSEYAESEESTRYWVTVAEMWATGGSGGTPSATNNSKYYSELAEDYKIEAHNSAEQAEGFAQDAWDYANSVNPDKLVHKDSEEQSINGTMADVILSQADAENSQNLMGLLPVEPNEATTMSVISSIPTSMSATGATGQVAFDLANKYVYICVASNSWKRFTLSDF